MSIAADLRALTRLRPADLALTTAAVPALVRARRRVRAVDARELLERGPRTAPGGPVSRPAQVAAAVQRVDRLLPGDGRCLVTSVALQAMLARRGVAAPLRIGVQRGADGAIGAHAWVEHEGRALIEPGMVASTFSTLQPVERPPLLISGEVVATDLEIGGVTPAPPGTAPTIEVGFDDRAGPATGPPVADSLPPGATGEPTWTFSRGEGFVRLTMPGGSDFDLDDDGRRMTARGARPGTTRETVAQELMGPGLSLVAAVHGRVALHAGCVEVDGGVVALLGHSGAGKSTLSRHLTQQGFALFADDIVVVDAPPDGDPIAHAGSRAQKLDPAGPLGDLATGPPVALSAAKRWVPIGGECSTATALPLRAIFLIAREDEVARWERRRGAAAFASLLEFSVVVGLMKNGALGEPAHSRQHEALARIASAVPVGRLVYPDGPDGLAAAERIVRGQLRVGAIGRTP